MMYSVLLVLALAAQGYARPNCFFACDYPVGQAPMPSFPSGSIVQPGYPSGSLVQPGYPSGSLVQPGYPSGSLVQPGYPGGSIVQPAVESFPVRPPPRRPAHIETFQPSSGGHMSFNHESQSSQKTSITGSYHFPAPSPPMNEPMIQPIQKPCRIYSDCY